MLVTVTASNGARIEMDCGFIERTDRGLQCEFNNIFTDASTEVFVTETNSSIDSVSFRQSQLFSIPANIFRKFPQLKHLDVELTQIKEIATDNFRDANNLKYFMARYNDIVEVKSETFASCPLLKFIVLQYNRISSIQPNAFNGLTKLEALFLDYNKLVSLPSNLLDEVPSLLHFSIAYNNLTTIPNDLFTKTEKLETFNIGHNLLTSFNETQFVHLPNLERIQLDHNRLRNLDLGTCKSTEINIDKNELEELELNKWTRFVSAWGNPIKKFTLNEHYGTGRNYNLSFTQVNEIVFFVNENCCTVENLENFSILTQSFGDLSQKMFNNNDWSCKYLKTLGYQTPNGLVVNNVCTKISVDESTVFYNVDEEETTENRITLLSSIATRKPQRDLIYNQEDYIESDELTTKPRESIEDTSDSPNIFTGMNIETLDETRTTTIDPDAITAYVEEFFPTTTDESYEQKCEKGIYKTVKKKIVGFKDKAVRKWNDWFG